MWSDGKPTARYSPGLNYETSIRGALPPHETDKTREWMKADDPMVALREEALQRRKISSGTGTSVKGVIENVK